MSRGLEDLQGSFCLYSIQDKVEHVVRSDFALCCVRVFNHWIQQFQWKNVLMMMLLAIHNCHKLAICSLTIVISRAFQCSIYCLLFEAFVPCYTEFFLKKKTTSEQLTQKYFFLKKQNNLSFESYNTKEKKTNGTGK